MPDDFPTLTLKLVCAGRFTILPAQISLRRQPLMRTPSAVRAWLFEPVLIREIVRGQIKHAFRGIEPTEESRHRTRRKEHETPSSASALDSKRGGINAYACSVDRRLALLEGGSRRADRGFDALIGSNGCDRRMLGCGDGPEQDS